MARFMAIYTGTPGAQMPDEQTVAKGMAAWQAWMQTHAAQIADAGGPLGKTKRVSKTGVADSRNNIAAYVVVEAADQDVIAQLGAGVDVGHEVVDHRMRPPVGSTSPRTMPPVGRNPRAGSSA